jgi:tetratricopeptide (TPR) repeat protein
VGKFVKRNRAPVLVAALLSISLIAGVIGTGWGLIRSKEALRAEADQRNRAEKAAANASALNDFLTEDLLGQADPDRNSPERKVTVEELLRRAEQRIDRSPRFDDQPAAAATLHGTIARTYAKLGLFPEAERHFRRALSIRRGVTGPDAPETLAAQEALADFLNLALHRPSESEPLAKETWQARARVLGSDHPDTLDSLDTYATAVILAGRPREAADLGRRCLQARARTLGTEHEQTVISMNNLANQLADLGEMDESLSLLRQVFAIRQKPGSAKSELAASVYNLAITLLNVGNMAEADGLVTEYAEWAAQTLGPETPGAERLSGLAVRIAVDCGRLDEAIEHGRNVLAHRRKLYPVGDFRIGMVLLDLGRAQAMKNEFEAAQRDLDEAYDILRNASVSLPHYWVPLVQCWRAACFTGLGLYTDAEPLLLQAELDLRMATTAPARHYQVAVEQLIALYHKWGRSGPANEWRKKLPTNDIDRRVQL